MARVDDLLPWVTRLTGIERARCNAAIEELCSWDFDAPREEFLARPDVDTLVAAVLLAESVRDLSSAGVAKSDLLARLRATEDSHEFWVVWTKLRSAAVLIGHPEYPARLSLVREQDAELHFELHFPDGGSTAIVFVPVALAEAEIAWHRRANQQFDALLPPIGLATLHGRLDGPIRISRMERDRGWKKSRLLARQLKKQSPAWGSVRGIAIVGHEAEEETLARVRQQIADAVPTVPRDRDCWVGLWWNNSVPIGAVQRMLDEVGAPPNITGLVVVRQAIAAPWSEINNFIVPLERGVDYGEMHVESTVDDDLAKVVLDRFEGSSGLRPTMLRTPGRNGITLLRRDGARRILPFNLLFDVDPSEAVRA